MATIGTEHHVRKQLGGAALIASPLLGLQGAAISPAIDSDEMTWARHIADGANRSSLGTILLAASLATGVFAVLAVAHMLRERRPGYGDVGGGVAMVGIVLMGIYLGMQAMVNEMTESAISRGETAAVMEDVATNPAAVLALIGAGLFAVGMIVLAAGLFQAEAVPWPSAVGLAVFAVLLVLGYQLFLSPVIIAAFAVATMALAPVGWMVLREPDEAWEHSPRFHGFHTVSA